MKAVRIALLIGLWAVPLRCAVAAEPKEPATPPTPTPAAEAVRRLLDAGLETGSGKLQAAQKLLPAARKAAPDDPRVDYAYGLVLMKHSQSKGAAAQFEAAVNRPGDPYWPAWQGAIWLQLAEKKYEPALERLEKFAGLLAKSAADGDPKETDREAAGWIGRILAALDKTVEAPKTRDLIAASDQRILKLIGNDLYDALHAGREAVRDKHDELSSDADLQRDLLAKKQERDRRDKTQSLESEQSDVKKKKDDVKRTADEWKKWLDDQTTKADRQLSELERDYAFLEKQSQSVSQSIVLLGRELTVLQGRYDSLSKENRNTQDATTLEQQINLRQQQMNGYQLEYNTNRLKMLQTARQAGQVVQGRAASVKQFESATGELVKKTASLEKWSARLNDKKAKVAATSGKSLKTPKDAKLRSLASFVPLDPDAEKIRVLESFGFKEPSKETPEK